MAIYAVHSPAHERDPVAAFERARTLKLGFAIWAFVFGPFWLLAKGLWLALAGWVLGAAIVGATVATGVLRPEAGSALYWLAALFLGFEGRALQAAALTRAGRPLADIVGGLGVDDAERGFLARALDASAHPPAAAARAGFAPPRGESSIIGLFPEAGAR
jgi:hypothetical protein